MTEEKTGPQEGPDFSNWRRGGQQYLPEGNMLHAGDSGRIYPAQQRALSMRSVRQCDNADRRMSAIRNRKSLGIPQSHRSLATKATTLIVELWQRVRSASAVHSQPGSRGTPGCGQPT